MIPRAEDLHKKAKMRRQEEFERIQQLADKFVNSVDLQRRMESAADKGHYGFIYIVPDFYKDALYAIEKKLTERNFSVSHRDRYTLFISWADAGEEEEDDT